MRTAIMTLQDFPAHDDNVSNVYVRPTQPDILCDATPVLEPTNEPTAVIMQNVAAAKRAIMFLEAM